MSAFRAVAGELRPERTSTDSASRRATATNEKSSPSPIKERAAGWKSGGHPQSATQPVEMLAKAKALRESLSSAFESAVTALPDIAAREQLLQCGAALEREMQMGTTVAAGQLKVSTNAQGAEKALQRLTNDLMSNPPGKDFGGWLEKEKASISRLAGGYALPGGLSALPSRAGQGAIVDSVKSKLAGLKQAAHEGALKQDPTQGSRYQQSMAAALGSANVTQCRNELMNAGLSVDEVKTVIAEAWSKPISVAVGRPVASPATAESERLATAAKSEAGDPEAVVKNLENIIELTKPTFVETFTAQYRKEHGGRRAPDDVVDRAFYDGLMKGFTEVRYPSFAKLSGIESANLNAVFKGPHVSKLYDSFPNSMKTAKGDSISIPHLLSGIQWHTTGADSAIAAAQKHTVGVGVNSQVAEDFKSEGAEPNQTGIRAARSPELQELFQKDPAKALRAFVADPEFFASRGDASVNLDPLDGYARLSHELNAAGGFRAAVVAAGEGKKAVADLHQSAVRKTTDLIESAASVL
jgi:hypothetical protein